MKILLLVLLQSTLANDFKLVKNENSIALYERWILHNGNRVRELKADFQVSQVTAERLELLLKNGPKGLRWNNNASLYKVIPGKDAKAWQVYVQYDLPWPMKDLDCLLAYQVKDNPLNGSSTEISFKGIESPQFPASDNFNRMSGTEGKWLLQEQGGELNVTYMVKTDRSRQVPRWVSDPIVHENLFKTMSQFKKLLEEKQ
ncbi:hypothetical protein EDD80_105238 [Anseongella ginsenosidimutans]|uniref:START domain-containing protein n=1 Tax=Anseongella ginsenosidimutans TaxID=496056 RepID=A0A4R3KT55_9SPHI|nr:hypothetical protein [Anseongella ginsenosidimutans]QEC53017.1 hypothetical protein FRZ59_12185 [Anseongella ginsenosidimutans]TCS87423.1 hypothetical protein EDD80_105238 [Anseongella ginsenosidimutans]